ncbi:non-hydrolyzing UDP-N-acetylglucosamine 2-epimerase [Amycolatopsis panacis]|uniref:UDP-N-acetylglucosamine 2-epimerase (Non-hydrolyzing) n=1 Tax=Amycolatopsis panacis TaxID=2340917 RepID=A0A419I8D0_9PSEU|nr:UDP-N-acetylglucosamine 2-epimerase (non-hydrolyzing) [Amycolatopsis panacis]RJQ88413.1 UDP-N-acetylglucosamine 2-epimerase (non-hydrolyzing) [Amycolatopsis panacis]
MAPTVLHVVSARPNFVKVAPIHRAIARRGRLRQLVVHTGQHYDADMSDVFFRELGLPAPDVRLRVGTGSHAEQTGQVVLGLAETLRTHRPSLVSVVGDTNGALSAALSAAKSGIPVAHVEAGLRSYDRAMPEELNRVLIDHLAEVLLIPSEDAFGNLRREGIGEDRVHHVGNVMIDTLLRFAARAKRLPVPAGLVPGGYALCTLHRPSNVDNEERLLALLGAIIDLSARIPVVFPSHPRTRAMLDRPRLKAARERAPRLLLVPPAGYLEFLALTMRARLVLTDSGGLQEETTALGVPCMTLRENTERPITVEQGTNTLVGTDPAAIRAAAFAVLDGGGKPGRVPERWDGRTADRIAEVYERVLAVPESGVVRL